MAKCAICDKGAHFGNNVSHSHRRSNKMWKSNVKSVRVKTTAGGAKKNVCMYFLFKIRKKFEKSVSNIVCPPVKMRGGCFFYFLKYLL